MASAADFLKARRLREVNYMRGRKGLPPLRSWADYLREYPRRQAPTPAPATPPPVQQIGPTTDQRDAFAYIQRILDDRGLGSLAEQAWAQIVAGATADEVELWLRGTQEWADRFSGMAIREQKGLPAISADEYIANERQYGQLMRAAGLPQGFYDQPSDFATWIGNDVSVNEAAERINLARDAAFTAPTQVRDELERLYGLDEGDLVAYFIDPDRALPLIERKYQAAQTGAAAQRSGFGALTGTEAEGIAALGISAQEAEQGFSGLASQSELFTPLDAGEDMIGRDTQLGAVFSQNAADRAKIESRAKRRVARFEEAGSFSTGDRGYAGIG